MTQTAECGPFSINSKTQSPPCGEIWVCGSLNERAFSQWLGLPKIPWPTHETGGLKLDDDT